MKLEQVDRKKLLPLLDNLTAAVEDLLVTGLTTASQTTVQTLGVTFQESSRMGLLRLGTTLRAINEEVARFTKNDPDFSRKRLSFFLNRSWLLSSAIKQAIQENNSELFEKLMLTPSPKPVESIEAVTIGVVKRAASTFCAFDFRMRLTAESGHLKKGEKIIWSCVFPRAAGSEIPPEGYLHLPQKQAFKAISFLEPKKILISTATTSLDMTGCQRMTLGEKSTVTIGDAFTAWDELMHWDQQAALERIENHKPGPFDLEVELQEEVFFKTWMIEDNWEKADIGTVYPIVGETLRCEATVTNSVDSNILRNQLDAYKNAKSKPGTLYGLLHYEKCKLVLQPLTVFEKKGPKHLMISPEKIDPKALLAALKF